MLIGGGFMRALISLLLLLPATVISEEVRLEAGASHKNTAEALKKIAAVDITPNMEIVGSKGEWPLYGIYWASRDFDVILEISDRSICYWTGEDFKVSKMHIEESRRYARSITFDTEKKTYIVKKNPWWRFKK